MKSLWSYITVVVIVVAIGGLIWYQHHQIDGLKKLLAEKPTVVAPDHMGKYDQLYLEISKNMLTLANRIDSLQVLVENIYIPPEGHYQVVVQQDTLALQSLDSLMNVLDTLLVSTSPDTALISQIQAEIHKITGHLYTIKTDVTTSGFCLTPALGIAIDDRVNGSITLGSRLFFTNRWGFGGEVGLTPQPHITEIDNVDVSLHGFVDWRIPKLDNVAPKAFFGYDFSNTEWEGGLGLDFLLR